MATKPVSAKAKSAKAPAKKTPSRASSARGARSGKKPVEKRPEGRPPKYNPDIHPALAEAWAAAGRTEIQIAEKFGVVESTISRWKNEYTEFSEALKKGKVEPDDLVEACLFARATGYDHEAVKIFMPAGASAPVYAKYIEHYPPDVAACFIWLKNRRPEKWRERWELTGPNGGPLVLRLTSTEAAL